MATSPRECFSRDRLMRSSWFVGTSRFDRLLHPLRGWLSSFPTFHFHGKCFLKWQSSARQRIVLYRADYRYVITVASHVEAGDERHRVALPCRRGGGGRDDEEGGVRIDACVSHAATAFHCRQGVPVPAVLPSQVSRVSLARIKFHTS